MTIAYIPEYFKAFEPLRVAVPTPCPYEIGDEIRFRPAAFARTRGEDGGYEIPIEVTGTVIQIHEEHRWYRVEYTMPGCIGRECFKF